MVMDQRESRKRVGRDERRRMLVDAALQVFSEKGFAGARLDDVAERAGVAKGTIYLYFKTKDELFEGVVQSRVLPSIEAIERIIAEAQGSSEALLRAMMRVFYKEVVESSGREVVRLLIAEAANRPELGAYYHREVISRGLAVLRAIIARGIARGEFREGPLTRRPEAVVGPAILAAVWKLVFEPHAPLDLEAYFEAHAAMAVAGLKAAPGRRDQALSG